VPLPTTHKQRGGTPRLSTTNLFVDVPKVATRNACFDLTRMKLLPFGFVCFRLFWMIVHTCVAVLPFLRRCRTLRASEGAMLVSACMVHLQLPTQRLCGLRLNCSY
jgi:hypothetical protein